MPGRHSKKTPLVYRQLRSTEVALALVHKSDIYVPVDLSLNSRVILVLKLSIFTSKEKKSLVLIHVVAFQA